MKFATLSSATLKKNLKGDQLFKLSTPTIIEGKEHVVAVLSKYPVIRMMFETDIGPVDLNLFVDEIYKKLGQGSTGTPLDFEYNEELIKPILTATENIFQNYLGLNIRKKGVTLREKLMPKFELSAIFGCIHGPNARQSIAQCVQQVGFSNSQNTPG